MTRLPKLIHCTGCSRLFVLGILISICLRIHRICILFTELVWHLVETYKLILRSTRVGGCGLQIYFQNIVSCGSAEKLKQSHPVSPFVSHANLENSKFKNVLLNFSQIMWYAIISATGYTGSISLIETNGPSNTNVFKTWLEVWHSFDQLRSYQRWKSFSTCFKMISKI